MPARSHRSHMLLLWWVASVVGCGRQASSRPAPAPPRPSAPSTGAAVIADGAADRDSCAVGPDSVSPPRNVVVVLTEAIGRANPALATSRAERFIARQLYQPLVGVSCTGRVVPALAESWASADSGRIWIFTIRKTARFWDGTPALSHHVVAAWSGYAGDDAQVPWAGIEHARAVDERRVAVFLAQPSVTVPRLFADPRLVVTLSGRVTRSSRVMGTGPYRVSFEDSAEVVMDAWDSGIPGSGSLPRSVDIRSAAGTAARDLVDRGADLLITDDRSLLEYATQRGQYRISPLPWDRSYVLFVPSTGAADPPSQTPGDGFLEAMAREAVDVEARVGSSAGQWRTDRCGLGTGSEPDPRRQPRRVVYPSSDETARELAHRLVAFAGAPGQGGDWLLTAFRQPASARSFPFAIGLEPAAWPRALQRGDEIAYILDQPVRAYAECAPPSRTEGSWMPLLETRASVAARGGAGGLMVDWDGTPFFGARP